MELWRHHCYRQHHDRHDVNDDDDNDDDDDDNDDDDDDGRMRGKERGRGRITRLPPLSLFNADLNSIFTEIFHKCLILSPFHKISVFSSLGPKKLGFKSRRVVVGWSRDP